MPSKLSAAFESKIKILSREIDKRYRKFVGKQKINLTLLAGFGLALLIPTIGLLISHQATIFCLIALPIAMVIVGASNIEYGRVSAKLNIAATFNQDTSPASLRGSSFIFRMGSHRKTIITTVFWLMLGTAALLLLLLHVTNILMMSSHWIAPLIIVGCVAWSIFIVLISQLVTEIRHSKDEQTCFIDAENFASTIQEPKSTWVNEKLWSNVLEPQVKAQVAKTSPQTLRISQEAQNAHEVQNSPETLMQYNRELSNIDSTLIQKVLKLQRDKGIQHNFLSVACLGLASVAELKSHLAAAVYYSHQDFFQYEIATSTDPCCLFEDSISLEQIAEPIFLETDTNQYHIFEKESLLTLFNYRVYNRATGEMLLPTNPITRQPLPDKVHGTDYQNRCKDAMLAMQISFEVAKDDNRTERMSCNTPLTYKIDQEKIKDILTKNRISANEDDTLYLLLQYLVYCRRQHPTLKDLTRHCQAESTVDVESLDCRLLYAAGYLPNVQISNHIIHNVREVDQILGINRQAAPRATSQAAPRATSQVAPQATPQTNNRSHQRQCRQVIVTAQP